MMGKIYLVRHGETEWNAEGRTQGQTDIPLSDKGENQAQAVQSLLQSVAIDAVYSSDLSRTLETAQIIVEDRNLQVQTNKDLRERYFGKFEGLTLKEKELKYPEEFKDSTENDICFEPPGGESIEQTYNRIARPLSQYKEKHINESILIVGHGGSLRCGISYILDLPVETSLKFVLSNCSITSFETFNNNTVLLGYNNTNHLNDSNDQVGY